VKYSTTTAVHLYVKQLLNTSLKKLKRFENWFNTNFGWFFTNGMKEMPNYKEETEEVAP